MKENEITSRYFLYYLKLWNQIYFLLFWTYSGSLFLILYLEPLMMMTSFSHYLFFLLGDLISINLIIMLLLLFQFCHLKNHHFSLNLIKKLLIQLLVLQNIMTLFWQILQRLTRILHLILGSRNTISETLHNYFSFQYDFISIQILLVLMVYVHIQFYIIKPLKNHQDSSTVLK